MANKEPKRVLGDEWKDWDETASQPSSFTHIKQGPLLGFLFIYLGIVNGLLYFFYFLIEPRLLQIHQMVHQVIFWLLIGCMGILMIAFILVLLHTKVRLFIPGLTRFLQVLLIKQYDNIVWFARRLGYSSDKMAFSFIMVYNRFIEAIARNRSFSHVLVLLPRCIEKQLHKNLEIILEPYVSKVFVCAGGTIARNHIQREKPDAVIAIACERDLITGIQDAGTYLPVYAIPNSRPSGPCLNTLVTMDDIKKALTTLLGKEIRFDDSGTSMESTS